MFKGEEKCWAFFVLGHEVDFTVEFVNDHFADDKTKAYSINVHMILLILDGTKQLEDLALILFPYTNTLVNN